MNSLSSTKKTISILIPCFNEAECIPQLFNALSPECKKIDKISWNVVIINDGSKDQTSSTAISTLKIHRSWCSGKVIDLSRNFGKEAALLAGLDSFNGDACIIMDADLQDPPAALPEMVVKWQDGYEIVSGTRCKREKDNFLKKTSASYFYKLFRKTSQLNVTNNSSDFRLLDSKVAEAIKSCRESIRFSKGFFAWAGFSETQVFFDRDERQAGQTKWGSWKLWNYALDGIFNYSTAPLKVWSYLGIVVTSTAFLLALRTILLAIIFGNPVPGYASIFSALLLLSGIQLIGIGIIGEYLGRTYIESKRRPVYLVKSITDIED